MGILGISLSKTDNLKQIHKKMNAAQDKMLLSEKYRPLSNERNRQVFGTDNVLIPLLPFEEEYLYQLALDSDTLRTGLNTLRRMLFRRGIEVEAKVSEPDQVQEAAVTQIIKRINNNKQGLLTLGKQFEWDLNVQDNAYLLAIKSYYFDFDGKIIDPLTKTSEIIRASPIRMRKISDEKGNMGVTPDGKKLYVCPTDRKTTYTEQQAENTNFYSPKTGHELRQVFYRGEEGNGDYIYYYDDEVFYTAKHNPSLIYGYSPIFAIWQKIVSIIQQDRYIRTAYQHSRNPKGLLLINAVNHASIKKSWEELREKARENPHDINPLLYEGPQKSGQTATWIDLMKPLTEMQYTEGRNEMRRSILAIYGMMPIMGGDIETGGGLNNESEQITVSNMAIEEAQKIYNEEVFPWILKQFGITDYEILLREPQEKDELETEKLWEAKIQNATQMRQMGFEVTYIPKERDFKYSEESVEPLSPSIIPMGDFKSLSKKKEVEDQQSDEDASKKKTSEILQLEKALLGPKLQKFLNKDLEDEIINRLKKIIWDKNFEGVSKEKSDAIRDVIIDGVIQNLTTNQVTNKIVSLGIDKTQAETIARSEQMRIQSNAREEMFREFTDSEEKQFFWEIAKDNRVSELCKEVNKRTKKGVTLSELKRIAQEVAREFGMEPQGFSLHPNERSAPGIL